jgi:Cytochrome P460
MLGSNRKRMTAMVAVLVGIAGLSYILARAVAPAAAASPAGSGALVEFTPDGKLKQPVGYRIYMDPESFAHYEKTGEFRDGTVMVKELSSVGSKEATSGEGYFMGDFTGLEVSIKDSTRFKDEPGSWAYFSFGHKYPLKGEQCLAVVTPPAKASPVPATDPLRSPTRDPTQSARQGVTRPGEPTVECIDASLLLLRLIRRLACNRSRVPDFYGAVRSTADKAFAVATEGDTHNRTAVSVERQ